MVLAGFASSASQQPDLGREAGGGECSIAPLGATVLCTRLKGTVSRPALLQVAGNHSVPSAPGGCPAGHGTEATAGASWQGAGRQKSLLQAVGS